MRARLHALLLATLSLGAAACATVQHDVAGLVVEQDSRDVGFAAGATAPATLPQDRYLAFRATKANNAGFFVVPRDLWTPFRFESAGGLYEPQLAAKAVGGTFGIELDRRGPLPPADFYGISAQVLANGLNVFAYTQASGVVGQLFFQDATEIEFAIDADGTDMEFLAREPGDLNFQTIANVGFANQQEPLNPGMGAFGLQKKGVVGFDDFRVAFNGDAPFVLSAEQVAARAIWDATAGQIDAAHGLDGATPDYAAAEAALAGSLPLLQDAIAALQALPASKARKKAIKDLKDARPLVVEAHAFAQKQKKAAKAIGKLKKAFKKQLKAVSRIDPAG